MKDGFIKCAAATPDLKVANCSYNADKIIGLINEAYTAGVKILAFPELCVTGYTCADLFLSKTLLDGAENALKAILSASAGKDIVAAVGCPLRVGGELYNCAVVLQNGKILGVVPKKFLPNYNEFYEMRWFTPADSQKREINLFGETVPFGSGLVFGCENIPELSLAVEVCEDLWSPEPPSIKAALDGATIILNLSASNELVGKEEYRESLVKGQSARLICGYIFAGAGEGESTTDLIFGGARIISENGKLLAEGQLYTNGLTISEIDVSLLAAERMRNTTFRGRCSESNAKFVLSDEQTALTRKIESMPFVPAEGSANNSRCSKILAMQAHALAKRIRHTHCQKLLVGISGGLDSCLALLASVEALKVLGRPMTDITAVSMPCFGTTTRTKSNAELLCTALGVDFRLIDITATVKSHLKDISHDENNYNVAYENAQARERTQVLMDLANDLNGMVVGTGDLSELALGWATYNGDHISMYGVNSSVPKTLVRHIVRYCMDSSSDERLKTALRDILDTPVSPELLPAENGEISQKTEDLVGPYELHDFFLYYGIRYGFTPSKVYRLAKYSFKGAYSDEIILKWEKVFYKRFFAQQFKRSCLPDGVKIGSAAVSPRGDLRMPSDAEAALWLENIDK
ncbi:MAG: NAD(+) synthase [Oscillospiraceae bacterium]|nr:NAD(+) synthase [Oscillospiraceae bacterium]